MSLVSLSEQLPQAFESVLPTVSVNYMIFLSSITSILYMLHQLLEPASKCFRLITSILDRQKVFS